MFQCVTDAVLAVAKATADIPFSMFSQKPQQQVEQGEELLHLNHPGGEDPLLFLGHQAASAPDTMPTIQIAND